MAKSKLPKSTPVADAEGPLTLAQARAIVSPPPATSGRRSARSAIAGNAPDKPASLPEALGAERVRQKRARKDEEKRRINEYKATLALLKKRGVKGLGAPPASKGRRRAPGAPAAAPMATAGPLQIFAEGDSWFDYPVPLFGGGVIPRLEDRLGVPILNMAKAGDEVRFMMGVEQRQALAKRFTQGCPVGGPWDLLLFSGGGNDIVDNPMALWIRDYKAGTSATALIHQSRYQTALDLVRAGYEDLIAMRDDLSPSTHLVFHAYDYAIPDGRGICHLGPWLKPTFDVRGYPVAGTIRFEVVKAMLKQFAVMLGDLAGSARRVTFINTQGTLAPRVNSWHNELHPAKAGFNAVADVFHAKLKALFPNRVL